MTDVVGSSNGNRAMADDSSLRAPRGNPWPRTACIVAACGLAMTVLAQAVVPSGKPQLLQVGPHRTIKTIAAAAQLAKAGAAIDVDAGNYTADVAIWQEDNISIRAVGGRVQLIAHGAAAEGKAIWVVRANGMQVEGFDFEGAAVPDRNGAGIRLERGSLRVRDCRFLHNEMGLLTSNDPDTVLEVANSEFAYNQRPDGHNHNLYVGQIASLSVTGSYFHHAHIGHLLKSRAAVNHIYYNRLTDEAGGQASYELEFPNGGVAYVVGNIVGQSAQSQNPNIISYGVEGYKWPKNQLYLVNNTLVDNRPKGGAFLRIKPGDVTIKAVNNLLVGHGGLETAGPGEYSNNFVVDQKELVDTAKGDYRLRPDSQWVGKAVNPGSSHGIKLQPVAHYVHPASTKELIEGPRSPGALPNGPPRPAASR